MVRETGYETLSRLALNRLIFPGLFLRAGAGESSRLLELDSPWAVVRTKDNVFRAGEHGATIKGGNYGGLRHNEGPRDVPTWVYGYRAPIEWYRSGGAHTLLKNEEKPRPSMTGVVVLYMYEGKSDCFRRDTPDFDFADFLLNLTKGDEVPWSTLPTKQLYIEGKGRELKSWLVMADTAPASGLYNSGQDAVHIRPAKGTPPAPPVKGKGKNAEGKMGHIPI